MCSCDWSSDVCSSDLKRWPCSLQFCQIHQIADSFWNGPAQLVLMQPSLIKRPSQVRLSPVDHQTAGRGWACSLQVCQIHQIADSFWNGPAQLVLFQTSLIKRPSPVRVSPVDHQTAGRGWACSLHVYQIHQIADSFWNGPAQLVPLQASLIKRPSQVRPKAGRRRRRRERGLTRLFLSHSPEGEKGRGRAL